MAHSLNGTMFCSAPASLLSNSDPLYVKSEVVGKYKDSKQNITAQDLISSTLESPIYQSDTVSTCSHLYL